MYFAETVFRRKPCEFSIEWYDKKSCLMKFTFTVMFELMVGRGVVVNVFSYIILISGCSKSWKIDEEILQYSALSKHASQRIEARWGNLHHNFEGKICPAGRVKTALKLVDDMKTSGQSPVPSAYAILLDGLCKNREINEVVANLVPSLKSTMFETCFQLWRILIHGLC